jgi:hypothetical protein
MLDTVVELALPETLRASPPALPCDGESGLRAKYRRKSSRNSEVGSPVAGPRAGNLELVSLGVPQRVEAGGDRINCREFGEGPAAVFGRSKKRPITARSPIGRPIRVPRRGCVILVESTLPDNRKFPQFKST